MFIFNSKQISEKKYLVIFLIIAILLFLYHLIIYTLFTSKVLNVSAPMYVGDLARMSYQINSIDLKKNTFTLNKKHIEGSQYKKQNIDLLTIGYSFSNGGGSGENPYYQDYIVNKQGLNVLNIRTLKSANSNVPDTLLALERSGVLDDIKPKAILLTTGSRVLIERFAKELKWNQTINKESIYNEFKTMHPHELAKYQAKNVSIVNTANYKYPFYTARYKFKPCIKDVACKLKLDKPYFSVKDDKTLLFYYHDIKNLKSITYNDVLKANKNLNKIAHILKEKGIKLYFMMITDKYDLYYNHIVKSPFIKNKIFDLMEPMKKDYTYIDTKKILSKLVDKGVKNIYYADDTHWSNIASQEIVRETSFK